jgi:hypothetical protein
VSLGDNLILEVREEGAKGAMESEVRSPSIASEKCGIKVKLFCRDGWQV